ncbi:DMT family transporter [Sporanaerobacter acetigenes]|uniref:EamA domain-containing membrane protein RarD n=1 Tax=Sporanaerobacter acetigenes DSM 13106 TaxID=1123281 RepID=A0A1M5T4M3_9FIRM|nr:DMT family transporter [Sporanaerobacter acetigenes]SHH45684.1 EamA domain-containing membrane protein RarD [Sporanaerobacter acetigenes DSM 13106]
MEDRRKGFLAVIFAGIIFGCMPLLAKNIYANGGNPPNLVFWRFFISVPILYLMLRSNDISIKLSKEELKKLLLVGSIGSAGTAVLLFLSYNYISTGVATTIHFMYPVFVILESIIFFHEKVDPMKIFCTVLCTIGILLLYGGGSDMSPMGIGLAFFSGITYSFYVMYLDKSGLKSMNSIKLTFYICLISSAVMFVFSVLTGNFTVKMNTMAWLLTSILSIIVSLGAVNLMNVGIRIIGPQNTAILGTFEPITSVIIGILIFGEQFSIKLFMGCILILISVILIAVFEGKRE